MSKTIDDIRRIKMIRYITPLREGGSLPALVDTDDDFKYVLKFRGAGHGVKALIAELIGGQLAKVIGLKIPELVFIDVDEDFGRTEADEEIQDLLKWSVGLNLGLQYLSGAINYDPAVMEVDSLTASKIVWLDAFLTNIDRTFRNTNMLMWNRELWMIDHGASLYFHHSWKNWEEKAKTPFSLIKDHVLLGFATKLDQVNEELKTFITPNLLTQIVDLIPDDWLEWKELDLTPEEIRDVYKDFLIIRLENADRFTKEAQDARTRLI